MQYLHTVQVLQNLIETFGIICKRSSPGCRQKTSLQKWNGNKNISLCRSEKSKHHRHAMPMLIWPVSWFYYVQQTNMSSPVKIGETPKLFLASKKFRNPSAWSHLQNPSQSKSLFYLITSGTMSWCCLRKAKFNRQSTLYVNTQFANEQFTRGDRITVKYPMWKSFIQESSGGRSVWKIDHRN